jgi:dTDP-4-amino-4,6-dideoxygalactose transaminase
MSIAPTAAQQVPLIDLGAMTAELRPELELVWEEALTTSGFIGGRRVSEFEAQWSTYCGTAHGIGVANGTDAIELTLRALGIGPGDEVIVPANTFIATAEAVVLAGATPRFVDVDEETLLLTPELAAAAISERTAAIIAVNLYGHMPRLDELTALADTRKIVLVEDAAQAQGAQLHGKPAGSFGIAGCFSFYPGKNLGAFGDAGAVVTSDPALVDRLLALRDHGRAVGTHHDHVLVGTNSRLDGVQAVVLSAKLRHLEDWNRARRDVMGHYRELLDPARATPVAEQAGGRGVHHLAVVRVADREHVRRQLDAHGIGTGIHYPVPCHLMQPYRRYADGDLPAAERAADEVLSLPIYPHLPADDVRRVAETLNQVAGSRRS